MYSSLRQFVDSSGFKNFIIALIIIPVGLGLQLQKEIETRKIHPEQAYQKVPRVFFSIDSLKQVFLNIIMNAIQAMPNGGDLVLRTYIDEGRAVAEGRLGQASGHRAIRLTIEAPALLSSV